ncbi:MAG: PQQ-dependent sugar dehydrogenase [Bacteroidota bacterium]
MKNWFILLFFSFSFSLFAQVETPVIELVQYAGGYDQPVAIVNAGDDRLFIVEQDGAIMIIEGNGTQLPTPFLDIDPIVNSGASERGLLGLAFHPDYTNNGYFYVNYTNSSGDTRISRFSVNGSNPNLADTNSEVILMTIDQPYNNHNGGDIHFGPDGYLYIGMGDGGLGGDPGNRSQNPQNLLGKMLRIDVDSGNPYGIPPDNPFVGDPSTLDEIWSLGLRNPWRFSFDRETDDMWIGDVGQNAWEEIDFEPAGTGGLNYGWRCYEGNATFNTSGCGAASNYVFPVAVTSHSGVTCRSITGGFVYRGAQYPNLYGHYLYADYCMGNIWSITPDGEGGWNNVELANLQNFEWSTFGEDLNGELYIAALDEGNIYRITELCTGFSAVATVEHETCQGDADGGVDLQIDGGSGAVEVVWSNGSENVDQSNLTAGIYTVTITDDLGCTLIEEIEILNSSPDAPQLSVNGPTDVCFGESVTITATAAPLGSSIQWYETESLLVGEVSTTLVLDEVGSGMYNAIFSGGPCSSGVSNVIEVNILPVPDVPVVTQNGNTLLGPVAAGYQWYLDGMIIEGATNQNFTALATGDYTLEVFNAAQCSSISDPVSILTLSTILPEEIDRWQITPTPFRESVRVEVDLVTTTNIEFIVTDVAGRIVYKADFGKVNSVDQMVNLSHIAVGVFFAEIKTESGRVVSKLVKQ